MSDYSVRLKRRETTVKVTGDHETLASITRLTHEEGLGRCLGEALMSLHGGCIDSTFDVLGEALVTCGILDINHCLAWLADMTEKMQALKARLEQEAQRE